MHKVVSHFPLWGNNHSPFFTAAVVERALVAVLETVAAAHLATELPTMSEAITIFTNNFEDSEKLVDASKMTGFPSGCACTL